jgi:hypothetical protein
MRTFDGRMTVLLFLGTAPAALALERASRVEEEVRRISPTSARTCIVMRGRAAGVGNVLPDEEGLAHERYGGESTIYAVRPDGHVGFRSLAGNERALLEYLRSTLA